MAARAAFLLGTLGVFAPVHAASSQRTEGKLVPAASSSTAELFQLVVVDRSGKPLPRAEVRFVVEEQSWHALRLSMPPSSVVIDGLLADRPYEQPGVEGVLTFAWPRGRGLLVQGRHGEQWGFRWFPRDWREKQGRALSPGELPRLELVPDWPLRVRVEDEGGRMLEGLPTRLCGEHSKRGASSRREAELLFEHVGFDLRDALQPLVVSLDVLQDPPVRTTVDPRSAPPGPVTLRLPPSGSVAVQVLDLDGLPTRKSTAVTLRFAEDPVSGGVGRFGETDPTSAVSAVTHDGRAFFSGVALGRELEVVLDACPETRKAFHGPAWAGETVSGTLVIPPASFEPPQSVAKERGDEKARPGSLQGFVLLDPYIPADDVTILLSGEGAQPFERQCSLGESGTFSFSSIPAGAAKLELWPRTARIFQPQDRPVLFTAELTIVPGENAVPELAGIDLRGKLFRHEIRFSGVDVQRRFHVRAYFGCVRDFGPSRCFEHAWQPSVVLVSPWPSIDVDLFAPGYRSIALRDLREHAEVQLEPGLPVKLRLRTDGRLPEPPRFVKAVLVPDEEPLLGIDWEGPAFGTTREVSTLAWRPGRMKITWIDAEYSEDGKSGGGIVRDVAPPQYVDVLDLDAEQVFEVFLSAGELENLLSAGD